MAEGKKRGRPSAYSVQIAEKAYAIAQGGATVEEIAAGLGIARQTFYDWRAAHPEFLEATRLGKEAADERVERSLYERAIGYRHPSVKIFMPAGAAAPVYAEYVEQFPPDTQAASLWLRNRQPEKWRDKVDHEITGKDGAPLVPVLNVNISSDQPSPTPKAGGGTPNGGD